MADSVRKRFQLYLCSFDQILDQEKLSLRAGNDIQLEVKKPSILLLLEGQ